MPGYDRTGPRGAGPMTGGARGRCNPAAVGNIPAYMGGYGHGRGLALRRGSRGGFGPGQGRGRGYGRGYGWYPPAAGAVKPVEPVDEMGFFMAQADDMKKSLDAIQRRIDELGGKPEAQS